MAHAIKVDRRSDVSPITGLPEGHATSSLHVAWTLIRKYPAIVIWPVLLLCLCLPLGTWAINKLADSQTRHTHDSMCNLASALSFTLDKALDPSMSLAHSIGLLMAKGNTTATTNSSMFEQLTLSAVQQANSTGLIEALFVSPWGRTSSLYDKNATDGDNAQEEALLGMDLLTGPYREDMLWTISGGGALTTRQGIERSWLGERKGADTSVPPVTVWLSLVVSGQPTDAQRAETYNVSASNSGVSGSAAGNTSTNSNSGGGGGSSGGGGGNDSSGGGDGRGIAVVPRCPAGICYDVENNTQWWGLVLITIDFGLIVAKMQEQAESANARFSILSPVDSFGPAVTMAATSTPAPMDGTSVSSPIGEPSDGWIIYICPEEGWGVSWRVPAIVVVVIGSLLLAACLMGMVLYRAHYHSLLESLLPKAALKQIVHNAKKQGRVELGISMPGTTAELILGMMRHLLQHPVQGISLKDVVAVQTMLHSTANIYIPMWQDATSLNDLDEDVVRSLKMALGGADAAPAHGGGGGSSGGDGKFGGSSGDKRGAPASPRTAPKLSRGSFLFDDFDDDSGGNGRGDAADVETLTSALAFLTHHTFTDATPSPLLHTGRDVVNGGGGGDNDDDDCDGDGGDLAVHRFSCRTADPEGGAASSSEAKEAGVMAAAAAVAASGTNSGPLVKLRLSGNLRDIRDRATRSFSFVQRRTPTPPSAPQPQQRSQPQQQHQQPTQSQSQQQLLLHAKASVFGTPTAQLLTSSVIKGGHAPTTSRHFSAQLLSSSFVEIGSVHAVGRASGAPSSKLLSSSLAGAGLTAVGPTPGSPSPQPSSSIFKIFAGAGAGFGMACNLERQVILSQLEAVLASAESFTFDAFALHEASNGHPLSSLAYYCMTSSGLVHRLGINKAVLCRWLLHIEVGYDASNPYHNATHAADVLQTYHALLARGGLASAYACSDIVHLSCLMAAIIHDVGHVGCTNDYLINTGHDLAIRFNDRAPLENMHMFHAWTVLCRPECNFLSHLPKAELMQLRRTIIELVLATDMKQHFSLVGQFNAMHGIGPEVLAAAKARIAVWTTDGLFRGGSLEAAGSGGSPAGPRTLAKHTSGMHSSSADAGCPAVAAAPGAAASEPERLLALQIALKCADLGHTTADLAVHQQWVSALEEELFRQGDVEKAQGLPISPLFDRTKQGVSKSQVGFYEVVVLPLYSSFTYVFPAADHLTVGALSNFRYWKQGQERTSASDT